MQNRTNIEDDIKTFISQRNYPCVAAIQALHNREYQIGIFDDFGGGKDSLKIASDLLHFQQAQKINGSLFLSFWAVFPESQIESEEAFEAALWSELSLLSAKEPPGIPWDHNFSSNPVDKNFCFSFGGDAFFVVGLHPKSSRKSRQFNCSALVFNLHKQFDEIGRRGKYQAMVATNRQRDLKFQGSVNPMVAQHGEIWEAIQFSGQKNSNDWRCPYKGEQSS